MWWKVWGGGGGRKRRRNPSQGQCRGWERKGDGKRSVGIHLLVAMGEGGFLISPIACLPQMPIIDVPRLVDLSLVKNTILLHEGSFCKNVNHITTTRSLLFY